MAYPALGIDVSKLTFDAALLVADGESLSAKFPNTPAGFERLAAWLEKNGGAGAPACLEATALHWKALATWLHEGGAVVSACNPLAIHAYAGAQLKRNKTDESDALLIARYGAKEEPRPWRPLDPAYDALRELFRRRDQLRATIGAERNRLGAGYQHAEVLESIRETIEALERQAAKLEARMEAHVRADARLSAQRKLLRTIPGIGPVAALAILSELGDLTRFDDARQVAAFAGLTPGEHRSGTSVFGSNAITRMGSSRLRRVLYMAAVSASTVDAEAAALVHRLVAPGESQRPGLVAVMHRLLRLAYGVLKSGRPYDPELARSRHPVEPRWLKKEKKERKPAKRANAVAPAEASTAPSRA
jgi:transposase